MNRCAGQERNGRGWYRRDQREQATAADRNCDGDRVAIGDLARLPAAQAVTTYRWRRAAAHITPLERGSPSGVTKLITAKAVFSSTRQIRSVVRLRADPIVVFRPRASPNTSTTLSPAHIAAHLHRPYSEAVPRLARAFRQEERIRVSTRWRSECRTRPMRCALRGGRAFELPVPRVISLYRARYIEICCSWSHAAASKTTTDTTASFSRCPVAASSSLRRVRSHPTAVLTKTFWSST